MRAMNHAKRSILILAGWYPSVETPNAGIFVYEQARALSASYNVVIMTSDGKHPCGSKAVEISDNVELGLRTLRIRYRMLPVPKSSFILREYAFFLALKKLEKSGFRPDILHAHVGYLVGLDAVILGKIRHLPVIITEHSSRIPRRQLAKNELWKMKLACRFSDLILAVSQNLQDAMIANGVNGRFRVLPNIVDTNLFQGQKKQNISQTKRILLVGGMLPVKGIPCFLDAIAKISAKRNDFVVDIVGEGDCRNQYESLAAKLGLNSVVSFHGHKKHTEIPAFMQNSSFLAVPSLWENSPCVIAEAQTCGLPVVASAVGGIPEMISESTGLLVPSQNTELLAEALNKMLDSSQQYDRKTIIKQAERYSTAAIVSELSHIYEGFL